MISYEKLFGNLFNSHLITVYRLLQYAKDHYQRLNKGNGGGQFTAILLLINNAIAALEAEVGTIDTTENIRLGQTMTVDDVVASFSFSMSDLEGVIAHALGGRKAAAYVEFYPHGITEYISPSREDMTILTGRIKKAAGKYITQLGTTVANQLQGFESSYTTARSAQLGTKADESTQRSVKSTNRTSLEVVLSQSIHTVGAAFPTDVDKCSTYFNFGLLYSPSHQKHETFVGDIPPQATNSVLNETLTDSMELTLRNTGTNANIQAWLAAAETDPAPADAVEVAPGKSAVVKPSDLGKAGNTFLLVKNPSTVNNAQYEIILVGGK